MRRRLRLPVPGAPGRRRVAVGYGLLPLVASVVLAALYVLLTDASRRSKVVVFVIVATSIVIWRTMPQWMLVALLLQVEVSIYLLLYLKASGLLSR